MTARDATALALATLEARWGAAAPRRLAALPAPPLVDGDGAARPAPHPLPGAGELRSTGFAALDAILGPGGLPRTTSVAVTGTATSGRTTLALRLAAEAQATGAIAAWLDGSRSLDPVEAAARGLDLGRLVVLAPASLDDGLAMAGALLQGRAVDLLVVDLPDRPVPGGGGGPPLAVRLERLGALARRSGAALVVLEPAHPPAALRDAVDGATGLRLVARRTGWIRLGRDVVGQRTEVVVERSRLGPPGRRAELRVLYAAGSDRDACLRRPELLDETGPPGAGAAPPHPVPARPGSDVTTSRRTTDDAPPPPPLVPPPHPARAGERPGPRRLPEPGRPRGAAVGRRDGPRHGSRGGGARRPARDEPRGRTPARP